MTAQAKKPTGSVPKTSNPPYPFRTITLLILLAVTSVQIPTAVPILRIVPQQHFAQQHCCYRGYRTENH